jgi:hypothetical protein
VQQGQPHVTQVGLRGEEAVAAQRQLQRHEGGQQGDREADADTRRREVPAGARSAERPQGDGRRHAPSVAERGLRDHSCQARVA